MMLYSGFKIHHGEDGFSWANGGYFETIEEARASIDDFNADMRSDENIYGLASIQQSIEEDRRR